MTEWNVILEPFQEGFFKSKARYPAFVSAWGTGKTMCGILKGLDLSTRYPGNLGLIVRKNFTDLRDSTIKDFTTYTGIPVPSNKDVKLPNGSEIMFRHMDELAGIVQNVNLGWFMIEQAEEFDSDFEFQRLRGRLRRKDCFHQGFIIANTAGHNWIYRLWKVPTDKEFVLYEASTFDNRKNLSADFLADLTKLEAQSPATYRRYVLNSWEDSDVADRVIPYEHLMAAVKKDLFEPEYTKKVVACDPAEFGDDWTVIYCLEGLRGAKIIDQEIYQKKEPMETAGRILRMSRKHHACLMGVDEIGIGSGIRSRLSELGANVRGIHVGEKASDGDHFKNLRSEIWWNAQEMFREGLVSLPEDDYLIDDLASVGYFVNSSGQVQIEKKTDIKKRINRSPDRADALVMGLWILKQARELPEELEEISDTNMSKSYTVKSVI